MYADSIKLSCISIGNQDTRIPIINPGCANCDDEPGVKLDFEGTYF